MPKILSTVAMKITLSPADLYSRYIIKCTVFTVRKYLVSTY